MDTGWRQKGESEMKGDSGIETYTLPYIKLDSGNLLNDAGSSNLVLCDNLEGCDGVEGRF